MKSEWSRERVSGPRGRELAHSGDPEGMFTSRRTSERWACRRFFRDAIYCSGKAVSMPWPALLSPPNRKAVSLPAGAFLIFSSVDTFFSRDIKSCACIAVNFFQLSSWRLSSARAILARKRLPVSPRNGRELAMMSRRKIKRSRMSKLQRSGRRNSRPSQRLPNCPFCATMSQHFPVVVPAFLRP